MIPDAVSALRNVLAQIPGIKKVYDVPPLSLNTAELPAAVIIHRGGEYRHQSVGYLRAELKFDIVLPVEPAGQSRLPEKIETAQALHDAVVQAIMDDITLGGAVDHVSELRDDNGYTVTAWAGIEYFSYVIKVSVVVKW